MPYADPIKRKQFLAAYYQSHKAEHKVRAKVWRRENRETFKRNTEQYRQKTVVWIRELRVKSGCVDCGERHPGVLDFHHLDPATKEFTPSFFNNRSRDVILRELAKCVVLCANCHFKRHWNEKRCEAVQNI